MHEPRSQGSRGGLAPSRRGSTPRPTRRRQRPIPLAQLALDLAVVVPRWTFSRRIEGSRHKARIVDRLEFVRRFFSELDGIAIHVGRAMRRDVLGWGSMDPARPGIWVRPRTLAYFTIAHEFVHLLQARGLVPGGERACDLWALARSPLVIDSLPGYLKLPRALRGRSSPDPGEASLLHRLAGAAIARRESGDRRYLSEFERDLARAFETPRWPRRVPRGATAAASAAGATLALPLES